MSYGLFDEEPPEPTEPEGEDEPGAHTKHPRGDYCAFCREQWPCAKAGELEWI